MAACQKGFSVGFTTAAALVHALMEARDERRLLRLQKNMADYKLLIIDELGFVPLSKTGAELLFELISQPSVPTTVRHLPPGNLDLRARKDHLSHAHAPATDRCSGR